MNHRNHYIVEHLRKRFMQRYGIELTKQRRLLLLKQIHTKMADQLFALNDDIELWRVRLYDQATYKDKSYAVIYNKKIDHIMTVIPPTDSEEFDSFVKRAGIPREQLEDRLLTAEERTTKSLRNAAENKKKAERERLLNEGLKRLEEYTTVKKIFMQREWSMPRLHEEKCYE